MINFRFRLITGVLCAFTILTAPAVRAIAPDNGAFQIELALNQNKISLGEPIVLSYSLKNNSKKPLDANWWSEDGNIGGFECEELPLWLSVRITDQLGNDVPYEGDPRKPAGFDPRTIPNWQQIAPGKPIGGQLVLSIWFKPPHPGRFQVTLSPHTQVRDGEGAEPRAFSDSRTFSLEVTMKNPAKLLKTAEALKAEAFSSKSYSRIVPAVKALMSMPEDVVFPVWRTLGLAANFHGRDTEVEELERLGTPAAKALIAEITQTTQKRLRERVRAITHQ
jgi:hypothetical protein